MALNEKQLMESYAAEIRDILQGPARHFSALHTPENAAADKGNSMRYCPGCRLIFLTDRLQEIARTQDDIQPQKRFNGKSRKDDALERLNAKRDAEI